MSPPRKRGRPRSFDEADALASILEVFWTKGFAATSLDDLTRATGLHRPSLYGSFGDKRSMYLRALSAFGEEMSRTARDALNAGGALEEDLRSFYGAMIEVYLRDGARGCPILTASAGDAVVLPEVRQLLTGVLARLDAALVARLSADLGQATGARLGLVATTVLAGLGVRARSGETRARLEELAAAAASLLAS